MARSKKQDVEEMRAEYCGPSWLVNRIWRISAVKALSGWSFCPRTYNVIPKDSPVFALVRENNVEGLQELFGKREASPLDCNEFDMMPLHVCINIVLQKSSNAEYSSWLL